MIKRAAGLKCCDRVLLDALHSRGICMRPLLQKPVRTPEGIRERKAFAEKYAEKTHQWWMRSVHAYVDNKFFPVYTTAKGRSYAAKSVARGTFRNVSTR